MAGPGIRGRETKLTPEVQDSIVKLIRAGNYAITACQANGIEPSTYYRWLNDDRPIYQDFRTAVKRAEAEAESRNIMIVEQAAITSWQAAAWWLERKHADRWGMKARIEIVDMVKREAERVAQELGMSVEEVLQQAEEILAK